LIQDTQVIVKVKDTGTPIDPDILPRLFSKFASKSFEDTRLGLFIAKSIVESHDGKIWLKIIILILKEKEEIHFPLLCQPSIDNKM
jgi:signal transduction histidine kinase